MRRGQRWDLHPAAFLQMYMQVVHTDGSVDEWIRDKGGKKKKERVDLDGSWALYFPLLIDFFSRRAPGVFAAALLPSCGVFLLVDFAFWTHPALT